MAQTSDLPRQDSLTPHLRLHRKLDPEDANESIRQRKKRLTHNRICDASTALFVELGYSDTTIDAIARRADISKPTFFNYFPSKVAVLHELIEQTDIRFVQYIVDELEKDISTAQRLTSLMQRSAHFINSAPDITRLILVEGLANLGNLDESRMRFNRIQDAMGRLINDGIQRGDVREDRPIDLLVQMLVGSYLYALLSWLSSRDYDLAARFEETASLLIEILERG